MPPLPSNLQLYGMIAMAMLVTAMAVLVPLFITCYVFLQRFATKTELEAAEKRGRELHEAQAAEMHALENRLVTQIADNRAAAAEHYGSLGAKIDALTSTNQLFVNETAKQTAALEGKMELIEHLTNLHRNPTTETSNA